MRTIVAKPSLARLIPALRWWPRVGRRTLQADLVAGVTGAVITIPQAVAYALIAGLPPEYGLYAAFVPTIVGALFGSSLQLVTGPAAPISIIVFSTVSPFAPAGTPAFVTLAITQAFLVGAMQFGMGLGRLGTVVNFVSHSVVVGFTAGAAILIATSQMHNVLGITISGGESFIHVWINVIRHLGETNPYVLAVSLFTLGVAVFFRFVVRMRAGMLIAMIGGSLLSLALGGPTHGVRLVGALPGHLPPLSLPDLSLPVLHKLAPGAFAVALLGLVEAVSIGRAAAVRTQQRIDGNQEFIGQGLANLTGSLFSSYAVSGSFTRTAINTSAGAKTPLAAVGTALMLGVIIVAIAPLTAYLPIPAMSGVVLLVAYNLLEIDHLRSITRTSKSETAILITTFLATLFFELQFAVYLGVILSLALYLNRTSRPRVVRLSPDPTDTKHRLVNVSVRDVPECSWIQILRVDGSIYFGAVDHLANTLQRMETDRSGHHTLIICSGINFIDVTGAEMLVQHAQHLRKLGGDLYLCGVKREVRNTLERGPYMDRLGADHIFASKGEAIAEIAASLPSHACLDCGLRIFRECPPLPDGSQLEGPTPAVQPDGPTTSAEGP